MKSIYASKLYKASNHKDKIKAALENPLNSELVMQLSEYLDEDYKTSDNLVREEDKIEDSNDKADEVDVEETDESSNDFESSTPSHGGGSHSFNPDTDLVSAPESEEDLEALAEGLDSEASQAEKPESKTVADATKLTGKPIKATTLIECVDIESLKNSLNLNNDTTGVDYVKIKESELWIYYNDDINLNKIMTDVVEYINQLGYIDLEFNRLARSDNAVVFEYVASTVGLKPIESEEE